MFYVWPIIENKTLVDAPRKQYSISFLIMLPVAVGNILGHYILHKVVIVYSRVE